MSIANITNLIVAVATLITSITLLVKSLPQGKKLEKVANTVEQVSTLVNGQHESLITRTQQLEQELQANSVPVPPDPNVKSAT